MCETVTMEDGKPGSECFANVPDGKGGFERMNEEQMMAKFAEM